MYYYITVIHTNTEASKNESTSVVLFYSEEQVFKVLTDKTEKSLYHLETRVGSKETLQKKNKKKCDESNVVLPEYAAGHATTTMVVLLANSNAG